MTNDFPLELEHRDGVMWGTEKPFCLFHKHRWQTRGWRGVKLIATRCHCGAFYDPDFDEWFYLGNDKPNLTWKFWK